MLSWFIVLYSLKAVERQGMIAMQCHILPSGLKQLLHINHILWCLLPHSVITVGTNGCLLVGSGCLLVGSGSMYVKVFPSVLVPQVEPLLQGSVVPFTNTGAVQFLALSLWAFPPPIFDCLLETHKPFLPLNYFRKQVRTGAGVAPRNKTFPIIIVMCIHFIINS